jgi:hypothetical protein
MIESDSAHVVQFYPSLEDQVYIASRIGGSVPVSTLTGYAYYIFLFLNVIVFPAFLWMNNYFITGIAVLALNVLALVFIIPRVNSDGYRKYYQHLYANRENKVARVVLNSEGATYESDGGMSFWPWRRIESIEETEEAIYFFFDGNGFAVRKTGFPYQEEANVFTEYARRNLELARKGQHPDDR